MGGKLVFRGIVMGIMGGVKIEKIQKELKYIGKGYLKGWIGNVCEIEMFKVIVMIKIRKS